MPPVKRTGPKAPQIALWRYEQIEEALGNYIHKSERGEILRRISRTPVRWPSGASRRISLASLYRWLSDYEQKGLDGLRPRPRRDRNARRRIVNEKVLREALHLLQNDPEMTFTLLVAVLEAKFVDQAPLPRSTLQRRIAALPEYAQLKRSRRHQRRRVRFVASHPHDIWHTDAKGPLPVRLLRGDVAHVHILSVIDDASRAVLAASIVLSPTLAAATLVFRRAAVRWGLPNRLYADRASIFEAHAFRSGLASLGIHRIRTKAGNAEAHGKIEAYHRTLTMWFCDRLHAQGIVDLQHLQQLLDGVLGAVYQPHRHRSLKMPPEQALGGLVSKRNISPTRLMDAFRQEKILKAHPKTGEIDIEGRLYLVPDQFRGQRVTVLVDPAGQVPPLLSDPSSQATLAMKEAKVSPEDNKNEPPLPSRVDRWAEGPLQAIYDCWQGQVRPLAEPGFGLPELYQLLGSAAGRHVPQTDAEAALIQRFYSKNGPLPHLATVAACKSLAAELGRNRPIKTYLDALARRIVSTKTNHGSRR